MTTYDSTAQSTADISESAMAAGSDRSPRRLAACLAACEGIPTPELENGVILELVAACIHIRGDERLREILFRLAPPKAGPVRLVAAAKPAPEKSDSGGETEAAEPDATPIPICAVPNERARRNSEPERPPQEPAPPFTIAEAPPLTAPQKFRMGLRVRISPKGAAMMPPTIASPTGVVLGFSSKSAYYVRVIRDGRTSSETFHMDYWEEDPDYRDANESIVAGFRTPIRAGGARTQATSAPGAVVFSPVARKPPEAMGG